MTKSVLGIVGGSGLYDMPALQNVRWERIDTPWGAPSDQVLFAEIDGLPIRFLPQARARPQGAAVGHQLSRQHRRPEAHWRHRPRLDLGLRLAEGGAGARPFRDRRPVHRPHVCAREELLRARLRGARVDGRSREPAAGRCDRAGRQGREHRRHPRRHLPRHGGPAVLHPRREQPLPQLGLRGDRHDQHAGGQARARGRDLLRHGRPW